MTTTDFVQAAERLDAQGIVGRFAVVLQHRRPGGPPMTSALLQWAVPPGQEVVAVQELGRHRLLTHAHWRDGGEALGGATLFGVLHAPDRAQALAHRDPIDQHLRELVGPVISGVHSSQRSQVGPSEILPSACRRWWDALPITSELASPAT